ncbi:MAG TPA: septum formation initiator family protein [Acidimicrobiales bacterium]|nr:septum formation initiator family protein [Acidimicrobiales bacterium]
MKAPKIGRGTRMAVAGVGAIVLLILVFLGPGSFRVWSSQRSETSELNAKIEALDRANARMEARAAQLKNSESIEELARRDYGMVPKGSKAFAILPAPRPDKRPGGTWPFVMLRSDAAPPGAATD